MHVNFWVEIHFPFLELHHFLLASSVGVKSSVAFLKATASRTASQCHVFFLSHTSLSPDLFLSGSGGASSIEILFGFWREVRGLSEGGCPAGSR